MTRIVDRFMDFVEPEPMSGCWLWAGSGVPKGYGEFWVGGTRRAHRVSWELFRGPIPAGKFVLHKCDVPSCVNPWHLYVGTSSDNMRDASRRGRLNHQKRPEMVRGYAHGGAKSPEQIALVRTLAATSTRTSEIAIQAGMSIDTVQKILSGQHHTGRGEK